MTMQTFARLLAVAAAGLMLGACATREPMDDFPEQPFPEPEPRGPANGAIYQAGTEVALFENATARRVGDIVTIRLVEQTAASKSSSMTTSKSTSIELPGPTIAGRPVTVNG